MSPPPQILDSHIHLWPSTSLTPTNHSWMTPGHPLAKRHGITDYTRITSPTPQGFIYVETDRYLPSPSPSIQASDTEAQVRQKLSIWAHEPLEEIRFLRRIVEGKAQEGDGVETAAHAQLMKGCVLYAPFHIPPTAFKIYLSLAEEAAGPLLWNEKVVGFRYLLQGKAEGEVAELVGREAWIENIVSLGMGRGGDGWSFDVGVDGNRDGWGPLEDVRKMISAVREREARGRQAAGGGEEEERKGVRFVLNHLCKPRLTSTPSSPPQEWTQALHLLSSDPNIYMKLSGAFNEFDSTPPSADSIAATLFPFVDAVFRCFPNRVMFGSDWPVCNVGGPAGEEGNWKVWVEVVRLLLEKKGVSGEETERVWSVAGREAYGLVDL